MLEKNHFLGPQNRSTVRPMINYRLTTPQCWLLLMVVILVLATIAPVAVLAG